jgi:hypothetical protein
MRHKITFLVRIHCRRPNFRLLFRISHVMIPETWATPYVPLVGDGMSRKRYVVIVLYLCAIWLVQAQQSADATRWFSRPSEIPKDVFDLPQFDTFRTSGKLDFAKAQAFLEAMSDSNLPAAQKLFDIFAWQAFVALNSPTPGNSGLGPLDPATPLAWESWQQTVRCEMLGFVTAMQS